MILGDHMLLAQLSDPHITAPGTRLYNRVDTARHLGEAVAALMALDTRPDVLTAFRPKK